MNAKKMLITSAIFALMAAGATSHAETITFSGYTWEVKSGTGGPGPNNWDPKNVWVDGNGWLHLKLTQRNGKWYCSEVYTQSRLGFGRYQFWLAGQVDDLDHNIVFGLFNYPTPDVGPEYTNEIDIEFAQFDNHPTPFGYYTNYSVYPTTTSVSYRKQPFFFTLNGNYSTHRFTWSPTSVFFQSQHGHQNDNSNQFASWSYQPPNPATYISQKPMPVHINLWCFHGRAPSNRQQVELVVRAFKFTPEFPAQIHLVPTSVCRTLLRFFFAPLYRAPLRPPGPDPRFSDAVRRGR